MSVEAHREALAKRHADLDCQIEQELKRPNPDTAVLATLKKHKLLIKEELSERLRA